MTTRESFAAEHIEIDADSLAAARIAKRYELVDHVRLFFLFYF